MFFWFRCWVLFEYLLSSILIKIVSDCVFDLNSLELAVRWNPILCFNIHETFSSMQSHCAMCIVHSCRLVVLIGIWYKFYINIYSHILQTENIKYWNCDVHIGVFLIFCIIWNSNKYWRFSCQKILVKIQYFQWILNENLSQIVICQSYINYEYSRNINNIQNEYQFSTQIIFAFTICFSIYRMYSVYSKVSILLWFTRTRPDFQRIMNK